jgi:hypothetical protein
MLPTLGRALRSRAVAELSQKLQRVVVQYPMRQITRRGWITVWLNA